MKDCYDPFKSWDDVPVGIKEELVNTFNDAGYDVNIDFDVHVPKNLLHSHRLHYTELKDDKTVQLFRARIVYDDINKVVVVYVVDTAGTVDVESFNRTTAATVTISV